MHLLQPTGTRSRFLSCGALLALSSLALIGCGDNMEKPVDAAAPDSPPAPTPPDARQLDASPIDGSPGIDAIATDANLPNMCDSLVDNLEPNDTAGTARVAPPDTINNDPNSTYGDWIIMACVRGTNEDWYRIEASQVTFEDSVDFEGEAAIRLRFRAKNAGLCPDVDGCDDVRLPDGPENTVTVEVYRASTMELLTSQTSTFGFLRIDGYNEYFVEDLLVRVAGPAQALYDYRMTIYMDTTHSEDECEC